MFEGRLDGALGDFVEGDTLNAGRSFRLTLLRFFGFLLLRAVPLEFIGEMGGDSLTLAIRVRRQIDRIRGGRQLFQLGDNFLFARDDDVIRFEFVAGVHTQSALG